ncbi:MAG: cytochrome c [Pseudomonadota bacterium]
MTRRLTPAVLLLCIATAALAHQGVTNPEVIARMEAMKNAKAALALLSDMAAGKTEFDVDMADSARTRLVEATTAIPTLFEMPQTDPKSEALPIIWDQFDDFSEKAKDTQTAILQIDLQSVESLQKTLPRVGAACRSCHEIYRVPQSQSE